MQKIILSILFTLVLLPATATAEPSFWESMFGSVERNLDRRFNQTDRDLIRDYYRNRSSDYRASYDDDDDEGYRGKKHKKDKGHKKGKKQKQLPPGLRQKVERGGSLPPGWQKKMARGEVIDGDVYRQSDVLPRGLLSHLTDYDGVETRVVDDQVFRVLRSTGEILDVMGLGLR